MSAHPGVASGAPWHERPAYLIQRAMEAGGVRRQRTQFLVFFGSLFPHGGVFAIVAGIPALPIV